MARPSSAEPAHLLVDSTGLKLCGAGEWLVAMSYKNALADVPFGGAKSVIIGNSARDKTPALLRLWTFRRSAGRRLHYGRGLQHQYAGYHHEREITAHVRNPPLNETGNPSSCDGLGCVSRHQRSVASSW
jgi:leucine dehydrogenase